MRALGIDGVAVYSDADTDARHVVDADLAVRLGPAPAAQSYLNIEALLAAAAHSGAQAIHPGYGFLAENARFAEACARADLVFIGPTPNAIDAMGDKVRAKEVVAAAGVRVVPGSEGRGLDDAQLLSAAERVGYPVLLKPAAGGGGKGMRLVHDGDVLMDAAGSARREEAHAAFGDDTLLLERYVEAPRHIEIQVVADHHDHVVHLGERECSLQRRHQKIVEECPSPLLDDATRTAMGAAAVDVARACGYTNAGTVEFIVSSTRPTEFFFLEMNTRLQVEHPVTEMVHDVDLVELQLRIAAGEPLPFTQEEVSGQGHAIEARIYAEDPARDFLPTGGRVIHLREPVDRRGVRIDSSLRPGLSIGSDYDPMVAKVIAHGRDRTDALRRLDAALADTAVLGATTNIGFLRTLLADPQVRAGHLDTGLVEADPCPAPRGTARRRGDRGCALPLTPTAPVEDPWLRRTGLEPGRQPGAAGHGAWRTGHRAIEVTMRHEDGTWVVSADDGPATVEVVRRHESLRVSVDGTTTVLDHAEAEDGSTWFGHGGRTWSVRIDGLADTSAGTVTVAHRGPIVAPMPGAVTAVMVQPGDPVVAGQPLAAIEAMKMEFTLRAPHDGVVVGVHATTGDAVRLGQPIVTVEADGHDRLDDERAED